MKKIIVILFLPMIAFADTATISCSSADGAISFERQVVSYWNEARPATTSFILRGLGEKTSYTYADTYPVVQAGKASFLLISPQAEVIWTGETPAPLDITDDDEKYFKVVPAPFSDLSRFPLGFDGGLAWFLS